MRNYAHPEALVSTRWAEQHLHDPSVKFVEVDVDKSAYARGHLPGAVGWNWQTDLNDPVRRDITDPEAFAELNRAAGIFKDSAVVLYGDNNNWFAAWAFWQFKYYGHKDIRLINGGRKKWELENRPLVTVLTEVGRFDGRSSYPVPWVDQTVRAFRRDVEAVLGHDRVNLLDVRSPDEFSGKTNAPPGSNETAQRSGRIPGAINVPWSETVNEDGTFKTADELHRLYVSAGLDPSKPSITYCRIGERSSHSWFVLKYLLGLPQVRNYDGSWTEWGNGVGVPIERDSVAKPQALTCVA